MAFASRRLHESLLAHLPVVKRRGKWVGATHVFTALFSVPIWATVLSCSDSGSDSAGGATSADVGSCGVDQFECAGVCVQANSGTNCGGCGISCGSGEFCQDGVCRGSGAGTASGGGTLGPGSGGAFGPDIPGGATGGQNGNGGTGGASDNGASPLAELYPCDGSTEGYDATAIKNGEEWVVSNKGTPVYTGGDMAAALGAAYGSLNANRSSKESILVQGSGDISGSAQIKMPSYLVLNICGTINVTADVSGSDRAPIYARDRSDIDIPHLNITGSAQYGMFFRDVSRLHLGEININGTGGLGIRIDSNGSMNRNNARDIKLDDIHVENTGGHGVELYGVDGIEIGRVTARRTGDCGLILNRSINANIQLIDAIDAAHIGTGYAAFRTANNNGQYDDGSYPTNIRVRQLLASGSAAGRGFFCVTSSGGVQIDSFTIDQVGGDPAIFIENCHNVTMASESGGGALIGGRAYLGHNTENGAASDEVTLQNITLSEGAKLEQNSATCSRNNIALNISGGSMSGCN